MGLVTDAELSHYWHERAAEMPSTVGSRRTRCASMLQARDWSMAVQQ
jgi:hypothetical protein